MQHSIRRLKFHLSDFIEPDFGLLDLLLSEEVLTHRQYAKVRSGITVYDRVDSLLESLTTEDQCNKLLRALHETGQQHVVNYITQHGGQKCNNLYIYLSAKTVLCIVMNGRPDFI